MSGIDDYAFGISFSDSVENPHKMNSNDLFSFLDETQENDKQEDHEMETDAPKKRKAPNMPPASPTEDDSMQTVDNEPGPSAPKKPRIASPKPVVVDEFETEAKREVAASAGLTGGVEVGSRLELKHQVCIYS